MKFRLLKPLCAVVFACAVVAFSVPAFSQEGAPSQGGGQMGGPMGMGRGQSIRGTVTSVTANQISIKTDEGDVYTVTTGDNTRMMKEREPATASDIHVGDMLFVGGEIDTQAKTAGAAFIAIMDAEQVRKMREDLGKTWVAGKITAIEDTKITVLRMDGVSQSIAVDENTSFHKRRESITMADIKVGDPMSARGALKDGVFVAAEFNLGMGGMMGMGRGHRGPGRSGDQPAPPSTTP